MLGTACTLSFDQPAYRPMVLGDNFTFHFQMSHVIKNRERRTDYGTLPHNVNRPSRRRRACTDLALNLGIQDIITSVRQRSPPVEDCADFYQRVSDCNPCLCLVGLTCVTCNNARTHLAGCGVLQAHCWTRGSVVR